MKSQILLFVFIITSTILGGVFGWTEEDKDPNVCVIMTDGNGAYKWDVEQDCAIRFNDANCTQQTWLASRTTYTIQIRNVLSTNPDKALKTLPVCNDAKKIKLYVIGGLLRL